MGILLKRISEYDDEIIGLRRELHQHAELSDQEFTTRTIIMRVLDELGISYREAGKTSVVASINGDATDGPERTIALRADMDALPIHEPEGLEFRSLNDGVMHACGHDAHVAMLLGAARLLQDLKEEFSGEVRLIFQEAEEIGKGAKRLIEEGVLDNVDMVFGMHAMDSLKTGTVSFLPGYITAASDVIKVRFIGHTGHNSTPHLARDTILPAAQFITQMQGIVTKDNNARHPLVLSVGKIQGGVKANIVASETELDIAMRSYDPDARAHIHRVIRRHADAVASAHEIDVSVKILEGPPSIENNKQLALCIEESVEKALGQGKNKELMPIMASDDFAYYLEKVPGVYGSIGYRNEELDTIYPPHNLNYRIDESMLKYGATLHAQVALDYMNKGDER